MVKGLFAVALLSTSACAIAAPPPSFSVGDVAVAENGGNATVTVKKSAPAKSYSKVALSTGAAGDTATAGTDYTATNVTLQFNNNELTKSVVVPILDDKLVEPNEAFTVRISGIRNASIADGTATVTIADEDAAPADIPPVQGAAAIDDNFPVEQWIEPGVAEATSPDPEGAFRFTCLPGHLSKDDPIVFPGQPGASHLHQFMGNTSTDAFSTYEKLRTTGGSTCTRSAEQSPQRTAYWDPAMLDGHGNAVKPDWMNTYYKQIPANSPANGAPDATHLGHLVPLPHGIRFIMGYNMKDGTGGPTDLNSPDQWAMGFDCVKTDGTGESYTGTKRTIAAVAADGRCPLKAWLRAFITVPNCWDGKNLDVADHRSHMVYATGALVLGRRACPADHPYMIPEIAEQNFYTVDEYFLAGDWRLSSDDMAGVPRNLYGKTWHSDYAEAWSPVVKDLWQTYCINGHLSCSSGELGDGRQVKGMQQIGSFAVQPKVALP